MLLQSKNIGKEPLLGKTNHELNAIATNLGLPSYIGNQLTYWLYKSDVLSIDEMLNISKKNREIIANKYIIGGSKPVKISVSGDGTKKYLFKTLSNYYIETAYIPDNNRNTLCISSQVGCKMGCKFCMTAQQGFQSNLTSGEIVNQLRGIKEFKQVSNIVFMGMGEPLDNYTSVMKSIELLTSEKCFGFGVSRITLSTIGILPELELFLKQSKCNLAISLHSSFDEIRREIMPAQKKFPISEVISCLKKNKNEDKRRVSFEYIMFKNINDTLKDVNKIASMLNGLRSHINLIKFHKTENSIYEATDYGKIVDFQNKLKAKGITTTIRASRGEDIEAACGLLSTKQLDSDKNS